VKLPSVAIVGRPNVGKSSLLNALCGERISIVDPTPGVTRDRVATTVRHEDRAFELVDTGGVGIVDRDDLAADVEQQINAAVVAADLVLFVVDVQDGLTGLDREAADFLRKRGKPILLVANKVDHDRHEARAHEAYELGLDAPIMVSAKFGIGIADLRDRIVAGLPPRVEGEAEAGQGLLKLAIVGQRNAGKSTLLNAILGEERMIVSEVPGTTRDSVDVEVTLNGRTFLAIDTAGARKGSRMADSIEFYSQVRSQRAVERADVVILLIDATKEVSQVDKMVADWVLTARKCCVIAVNKWDLAGSVDTRKYLEYLETRLPLLHYAPVVFLSAKDGIRVDELFKVAFDVYDQSSTRIATSDVNRVIEKAMEVRGPRLAKGRYPKVFYGTQVGTNPPWFVLFVNEPAAFKDDFRRFLENRFREAFGFGEVPVRISFRKRESLRQT
jgi:GTP-binding protein